MSCLVQWRNRKDHCELLTVNIQLAISVGVDARRHFKRSRALLYRQFVVDVRTFGVFFAIAKCDFDVWRVLALVEQLVVSQVNGRLATRFLNFDRTHDVVTLTARQRTSAGA